MESLSSEFYLVVPIVMERPFGAGDEMSEPVKFHPSKITHYCDHGREVNIYPYTEWHMDGDAFAKAISHCPWCGIKLPKNWEAACLEIGWKL